MIRSRGRIADRVVPQPGLPPSPPPRPPAAPRFERSIVALATILRDQARGSTTTATDQV